jgi:hypothetical protein
MVAKRKNHIIAPAGELKHARPANAVIAICLNDWKIIALQFHVFSFLPNAPTSQFFL